LVCVLVALAAQRTDYLSSDGNVLKSGLIGDLSHLHAIKAPENYDEWQWRQTYTQEHGVNPSKNQTEHTNYPPAEGIWVPVVAAKQAIRGKERKRAVDCRTDHNEQVYHDRGYIAQISHSLGPFSVANKHYNCEVPRSDESEVNCLQDEILAHVRVARESCFLGFFDHHWEPDRQEQVKGEDSDRATQDPWTLSFVILSHE
jgi:hypothetical protein